MSFGQGGPQWGAGGGGTPDWSAMAEETARSRRRRRRWLVVGGGALATAAVAGIVAIAVVSESGGGSGASDKPSEALPSPEDLPSSPGPEPSFEKDLPPAPPEDYLNSPKKDKAPLSEDTLFPSKTVTVNGKKYRLAAKDSTKKCEEATQAGLGPVLRKQGCGMVFRATYQRDTLAFTLGIAVFDSQAKASEVKADYVPNIASLAGGDVPAYCRTVTCRTTVNALGRYAFFTIAGHTDGKPAPESDKKAVEAALDGSDFGYARILQRGKDQAEADAQSG
ncbi:hypothetical protein LHJ74_20645 [Streptomyces sp. N2-109]|uniref:Uncharacterized protein n=1 Tax=Streptomyces gossypii TaxID=2883101 RepID=A0ABT2JWM5_9ACTN|nr:hypothetical protein [Streptomyces gossypii]MCT2592281.1 hypothetical protein [Streptomyces gossypii]